MSRTRKSLKALLLHLPYALADRRANGRLRRDVRRFLIIRHAAKKPRFHDYLLDWLAREIPDLRDRFELRLLPGRVHDWPAYAACAPWLQDPARDWMPRGDWNRLLELQQECDARGIPVLNRAEHLEHAVKSVAAARIAAAGVRTPRVVPVRDPAAFIRDPGDVGFPLIVREDRRHAAPTCLVRRRADLGTVPWRRFRAPVAAEFIDVRSPGDGRYRKYRYVSAGAVGVPRHLLLADTWEVRASQRLAGRQAREEELRYLSAPDPFGPVLDGVRRRLELDLVAFDYSLDPDGGLVVWEANPYANLDYPAGVDTGHTRPFVERSFAAVASMYLAAAGEPMHPRIAHALAGFLPPNAHAA